MFDLVRPPTDNLYKFLALSGLALFAFFGWKYVDVELERIKLTNELAAKKELFKADMIDIWNNVLSPNFKPQETQIVSGLKNDPHIVWLKEDLIRALSKALDDSYNGKPAEKSAAVSRLKVSLENSPALDTHAIAMGKTQSRLEDLPSNDDPQRVALLALSGAGLLLTLVGFVLWWRKVQRPLDEIMRLDLAERRARANQPTPTNVAPGTR